MKSETLLGLTCVRVNNDLLVCVTDRNKHNTRLSMVSSTDKNLYIVMVHVNGAIFPLVFNCPVIDFANVSVITHKSVQKLPQAVGKK